MNQSMNYEKALKYLKCTKCESEDLALSQIGTQPGAIVCRGCKNEYPISRGIIVTEPSLWGMENRNGDMEVHPTFKSYSNWWLKVNKGIGYKQDIELLFKEHTGKDISFLAGKTILDAGCGGGRFLRYVSKAEASLVFAFDLGQGLLLAQEKNKSADNIYYVQGNILKPPFRNGVFAFVYSFGVLHHTPDPKKGFVALSNLSKAGGHFALYLYYRPHLTFKDWGARYGLRQAVFFLYQEPLRVLITKLPHSLILLFSRLIYYQPRLMRILSRNIITNPLAHLLGILLPPAVDKPKESREHNVIRNYDEYSTRFRFFHSQEEVLTWYQEANFNDIQIRKLSVTMIGEKQLEFCNPVSVAYYRPSIEEWETLEAKGLESSDDVAPESTTGSIKHECP